MSADRPHDVSYELGGISSQLETITRTLSENRLADATYRTGVREEMGRQRDQISAVAADLTAAKNAIAKMEPKVESLDERAMMSKGAAQFAVILGKFGQFIWAGVGAIVVLLLDRFVFHKP